MILTKNEKISAIINTCSSCVLGIYLIHDIFRQILINLGFFANSPQHPIRYVPFMTLVIFSASFITVYLYKKLLALIKHKN